MRFVCLAAALLATGISINAQSAAQTSPPAAAAQAAPKAVDVPAAVATAAAPATSKACIAVTDAGSHAFRNIMLGGVAGALVSKKQYKVVDVKDYPAHIGQKFHGNDLQTLQSGGTRVVILDKKYTPDDLHKACQ